MGVLIIGAGQAGVQAADSLRAGGWDAGITLLSAEPGLPYQRPPLSKEWLAPAAEPAAGSGGEPAGQQGSRPTPAEPERLPLRPASFFEEQDISLLHGTAVAVDRAARIVTLSDGRELPYEHLILATGSRPRPLPAPGADLPGIHQLRTLDDARRLRAALPAARHVLVVGAGFIGLEVAAAARAHGCAVTVLEFADRPMGRALSIEMAAWFAQAHRNLGVDLRLGEGINDFTVDDAGRLVAESTRGAVYPADLAVLGIGAQPNQELAAAAGLETAAGGGILVDALLRTSDPAILAIGDAAAFPGGPDGAVVRLESVQNATEQGRHAAAVILGSNAPYRELPWFWSTQGPYRLQMAGLALPGDDTVLHGDPAAGKFAVLCFRNGILAAVETVNHPAEHMGARKLLAAGVRLTREDAAAEGFSLKAAAKAALRVRA